MWIQDRENYTANRSQACINSMRDSAGEKCKLIRHY